MKETPAAELTLVRLLGTMALDVRRKTILIKEYFATKLTGELDPHFFVLVAV